MDGNRAIVDVTFMGFTMKERLELVRLAEAKKSWEQLGLPTGIAPSGFQQDEWANFALAKPGPEVSERMAIGRGW